MRLARGVYPSNSQGAISPSCPIPASPFPLPSPFAALLVPLLVFGMPIEIRSLEGDTGWGCVSTPNCVCISCLWGLCPRHPPSGSALEPAEGLQSPNPVGTGREFGDGSAPAGSMVCHCARQGQHPTSSLNPGYATVVQRRVTPASASRMAALTALAFS